MLSEIEKYYSILGFSNVRLSLKPHGGNPLYAPDWHQNTFAVLKSVLRDTELYCTLQVPKRLVKHKLTSKDRSTLRHELGHILYKLKTDDSNTYANKCLDKCIGDSVMVLSIPNVYNFNMDVSRSNISQVSIPDDRYTWISRKATHQWLHGYLPKTDRYAFIEEIQEAIKSQKITGSINVVRSISLDSSSKDKQNYHEFYKTFEKYCTNHYGLPTDSRIMLR